eukprot:m.469788 g.469788  ORF g.469788 m.469788 type:complete len:389 (+) comp29114_c0_seq1:47-1213(+)
MASVKLLPTGKDTGTRVFTPDQLAAVTQDGILHAFVTGFGNNAQERSSTTRLILQMDGRVRRLNGVFKRHFGAILDSVIWASAPDQFVHIRPAVLWMFVTRLRRYEPDISDEIQRAVGPFHFGVLGPALKGCEHLQELVLPKFIRRISPWALANCTALAVVNWPDGIEEIGEKAFRCCRGLRGLTLPSNLSILGDRAFAESSVTTIDAARCTRLTAIHNATFCECYSLTHVTLPPQLAMLGSRAFASCASLAHVELPAALTHIGEACFRGTALVEVLCPPGVVHIGPSAFADCFQLLRVEVGDGVTAIQPFTFVKCERLAIVKLSAVTTRLCTGSFKGCPALKSLEVPQWTIVDRDTVDRETRMVRRQDWAAQPASPTIGLSSSLTRW